MNVTNQGFITAPLGNVYYRYVPSKRPVSLLASSNASQRMSKLPILAFHMSPRSVDEYADHCLAHNQPLIAFDELGYGNSDNPTRSCTIAELADNALFCANYLRINQFIVTGSLMGCYICASLASRYPGRVRGVIFTNLYHWPDNQRWSIQAEAARSRRNRAPISDPWVVKADGTHITELWQRRADWLDPELNTRVLRDELTHLLKRKARFKDGIYVQDAPAFDLESALRAINAPVLCIQGVGATEFFDSIHYNMSGQFEVALSFFSRITPIIVYINNPGTINLINQNAVEWSNAVKSFVENIMQITMALKSYNECQSQILASPPALHVNKRIRKQSSGNTDSMDSNNAGGDSSDVVKPSSRLD